EKITLRHTADFGGNVNDLAFAWYSHEEDGTVKLGDVPLLPSGVNAVGWNNFGSANGIPANQIDLSGSNPELLADNLFYVRWRFASASSGNVSGWSDWAGAANSKPPAYVPQLMTGWVKRVLDAVNPYEARISDFVNNPAPATYASLIRQAGPPYN